MIEDAGERVRIVRVCMAHGVALETCAEIIGISEKLILQHLEFTGQKWPGAKPVDMKVNKVAAKAKSKAKPKARKAAPKPAPKPDEKPLTVPLKKRSTRQFKRFDAAKMPAPDPSTLGRAKQYLQRRDHVVYDATVDNGPEGMIRVNNFTLTPADVIAMAERAGFNTSKGETNG